MFEQVFLKLSTSEFPKILRKAGNNLTICPRIDSKLIAAEFGFYSTIEKNFRHGKIQSGII